MSFAQVQGEKHASGSLLCLPLIPTNHGCCFARSHGSCRDKKSQTCQDQRPGPKIFDFPYGGQGGHQKVLVKFREVGWMVKEIKQ